MATEARVARATAFSAIVGAVSATSIAMFIERTAPQIKCLISFGVAGELAPYLCPGDVLLLTEVISGDRRWLDPSSSACNRDWGRKLRPDPRALPRWHGRGFSSVWAPVTLTPARIDCSSANPATSLRPADRQKHSIPISEQLGLVNVGWECQRGNAAGKT